MRGAVKLPHTPERRLGGIPRRQGAESSALRACGPHQPLDRSPFGLLGGCCFRLVLTQHNSSTDRNIWGDFQIEALAILSRERGTNLGPGRTLVFTNGVFVCNKSVIGEPAEFGKNRTLRFSGHP